MKVKKKKTLSNLADFSQKKTLLRCILPPIKTCVRSYSNFLHCDCCDCNLKQKTKQTPIYIYYKNKKQNVMSRFRSKIKGLVYCTTITEQNIHTYVTQSKNLLMYLFLYITDTKFVLDSFLEKENTLV